MTRGFRFVCALAANLVLPVTMAAIPASAGVINYQESVSGDLGDELQPTDLGALGVGTNIIVGHVLSGETGGDWFKVSLDFLDFLSTITLEISNSSDLVHFGFPQFANSNLAPAFAFFFEIIFGDGTVTIPVNVGGTGGSTEVMGFDWGFLPITFDYTITINVSGEEDTPRVPEPSSLLLALGLLGLAALRRRT